MMRVQCTSGKNKKSLATNLYMKKTACAVFFYCFDLLEQKKTEMGLD